MPEHGRDDEAIYNDNDHSIEEEGEGHNNNLQQLEKKLQKARASIETLNSNLQQLRQRIDEENASSAVQELVPLLKSLKFVESQESVLRSDYNAKRFELEAEVCELKRKMEAGLESESESERESRVEDLDRLLDESVKKLDSAKKELGARLRAVLSVKRKLDDVPTQSELMQYERRFSELNVHIQEKHRQTRKYYATYNALLEIKGLMLKETSLLNSISSQFQDAITSTDGRMKLIDSMEGIVKGSQQKLQKVQTGLQEEQKVCDALKKRYAAAMAEQRQCYSLLKSFQEECAKNERLQSQNSV